MRACRRGCTWSGSDRPDFTGSERCRCLTLSGPARGRSLQGRLNWVDPRKAFA
jgi:hypothetical protein